MSHSYNYSYNALLLASIFFTLRLSQHAAPPTHLLHIRKRKIHIIFSVRIMSINVCYIYIHIPIYRIYCINVVCFPLYIYTLALHTRFLFHIYMYRCFIDCTNMCGCVCYLENLQYSPYLFPLSLLLTRLWLL